MAKASKPAKREAAKKEATNKEAAKKKAVKKKTTKKATNKKAAKNASERWELRLYVAGATPKSMLALENLRKFCEIHLKNKYTLEIVDLLVHPQLAAGDQILAIPTLVRKMPVPIRKIIGDLSNEEKVLVGLNLKSLKQ